MRCAPVCPIPRPCSLSLAWSPAGEWRLADSVTWPFLCCGVHARWPVTRTMVPATGTSRRYFNGRGHAGPDTAARLLSAECSRTELMSPEPAASKWRRQRRGRRPDGPLSRTGTCSSSPALTRGDPTILALAKPDRPPRERGGNLNHLFRAHIPGNLVRAAQTGRHQGSRCWSARWPTRPWRPQTSSRPQIRSIYAP